MVTDPTPEQIAKLPKWAKDYLEKMTRLKERAETALKENTDSQTPSYFYIEESILGKPRSYIQTTRIVVEYQGVKLEVKTRDGIELSWEDIHSTDAAFIPVAYQQARLKAKSSMR